MKVTKDSFGLLLIFFLYVGLLWWGDCKYRVFDDLSPFFQLVPVVAIVSLVSFTIRFVRWHNLLRWTGYPTPWIRCFLAYLTGFAFTATPGKVGELARIRYLQPLGVPPKDVISVFIVERTLDLLAVLILSLMAVMHGRMFGLALAFVTCVGAVVAGLTFYGKPLGLVSLGMTQLNIRSPVVALEQLSLALIGLSRWSLWHWIISFALGLFAWSLTALSFVIVLNGLGIAVPILNALGMYPLAILVGAASMLPGGLGTTEAAILAQLQLLEIQMTRALAAAVVVRLGTLWFAVMIGFLAMLVLEWRSKYTDVFKP